MNTGSAKIREVAVGIQWDKSPEIPIAGSISRLSISDEESTRTVRLKGDLPNGTHVAHKSGTSGVDNGVAYATNDIGLITLAHGQQRRGTVEGL